MLGFDDFTDLARRSFDGIPEEFRRHVDGPFVEREAKEHEIVPGHYILGECVHHPVFGDSGFGGSGFGEDGPLFSSVILYYGSFRAIARRDPDFDVAEEIHETVLHEVRHHLEDAAGIGTLRDLDWAEDQNELRHDGAPHTDRFWRGGTPLSDDGTVWRVGDDLFVEVTLRRRTWERARTEGLALQVGPVMVALAADDVPEPAPAARITLDWEWSAAPELAAVDDGHGHGGPRDWGDLVVVLGLRGRR